MYAEIIVIAFLVKDIGSMNISYFLSSNNNGRANKHYERPDYDIHFMMMNDKLAAIGDQQSKLIFVVELILGVIILAMLVAFVLFSIIILILALYTGWKFMRWMYMANMWPRNVLLPQNARLQEDVTAVIRRHNVQEIKYNCNGHRYARSQGEGYERRKEELNEDDQFNLENARLQEDAMAGTKGCYIQETKHSNRRRQREGHERRTVDVDEQDQQNLFDEQDQINFAIGLSLLEDEIRQEDKSAGMPSCEPSSVELNEQDQINLAIRLSLLENNIPQEEPQARKQRRSIQNTEFKSRTNRNGRRQNTKIEHSGGELEAEDQVVIELDISPRNDDELRKEQTETMLGNCREGKDQTVDEKCQRTSTRVRSRQKRSPSRTAPQHEPREIFSEYFESWRDRNNYDC